MEEGTSEPARTLWSLLARQARRAPGAPAVEGPGRRPLSYGRLLEQIERTARFLRAHGVGRNSRAAIVLPNGPEAAVAFLAVAACAAAAPLNPAYRREECAFYLGDLSARAVIVPEGEGGAAAEAAEDLGVRILRLTAREDGEAGVFSLSPEGAAVTGPPEYAEAEDTALVLHTSGTTSRPKIVPLSQANLCHSAFHIAGTLQLSSTDRCLNVMPLFHIHGLMAALLASLSAGGPVVCTPGFDAIRFFGWLRDFQPTWYTAVPSMHQAILARAPRNREIVEASRLRFIRSSSAPLPRRVLEELEAVFRAPVVESYGMTEAAHQMASNPLPPGRRKPGSVGPAAGPEVAVMDEAGRIIEPGRAGEVVIRGPNVAAGYENRPEANEAAFSNGWFRTGDQGYLDEDGYLFLTGRIKEIINRGGEKISPREVEEVLLEHRAVDQAAVFAVPDEKLGETPAAAIVPREQGAASEKEIRDFASERLAPFKVPRRIVFVEEMPKGPTGKVQRVSLARKLGLVPSGGTRPAAKPR